MESQSTSDILSLLRNFLSNCNLKVRFQIAEYFSAQSSRSEGAALTGAGVVYSPCSS